MSFYLATGPSPLGARWIQEHFGLFGAQETNSYVGPCNRLAFNVGLHSENNDFTGVPWHRLPELRRRASEFYADQPTRIWGLSPLVDQQIAGVTMATEQAAVLFLVFLFWFRRFLAEEGAI